MRDRIVSLLMSTGREGMDKLVEHMDKIGFFTAACSTQHHLAKVSGLAEHSLNVLENAVVLAEALKPVVQRESIIIAALLHDIGKCGQFGKQLYVPNVLKSGKLSESKPFETNKELLPVDHEVRSVVIVEKFIDLTEDEHYAILMHNGLYGAFKYQLQGKETQLYMIIHWADMWASRVTEV